MVLEPDRDWNDGIDRASIAAFGAFFSNACAEKGIGIDERAGWADPSLLMNGFGAVGAPTHGRCSVGESSGEGPEAFTEKSSPPYMFVHLALEMDLACKNSNR